MTVKQYEYEVVSVNLESRSMMVNYKAEGFAGILVGARIPVDGETLAGVVAQFAPWGVWNEVVVGIHPPAVGESGTIIAVKDESNMTLAELKVAKRKELDLARQAQIESPMDVDGIIVSANDHTITMLRAANDALNADMRNTVDWRDDGGGWVTLNKALVSKLLMAVATRVEDCYTLNRQLETAVEAVTTAEAIMAIKWDAA